MQLKVFSVVNAFEMQLKVFSVVNAFEVNLIDYRKNFLSLYIRKKK